MYQEETLPAVTLKSDYSALFEMTMDKPINDSQFSYLSSKSLIQANTLYNKVI